MNKVYNWLIIAIIFALASILTMTFTNQPAVAWALMMPALAAMAMVGIRLSDYFEGRHLSA